MDKPDITERISFVPSAAGHVALVGTRLVGVIRVGGVNTWDFRIEAFGTVIDGQCQSLPEAKAEFRLEYGKLASEFGVANG